MAKLMDELLELLKFDICKISTLTKHTEDLNSVLYYEDHTVLSNVVEFEYYMHTHNLNVRILVLLQHHCCLKIDAILDAVLFAFPF